jgi:hypothetical protein
MIMVTNGVPDAKTQSSTHIVVSPSRDPDKVGLNRLYPCHARIQMFARERMDEKALLKLLTTLRELGFSVIILSGYDAMKCVGLAYGWHSGASKLAKHFPGCTVSELCDGAAGLYQGFSLSTAEEVTV